MKSLGSVRVGTWGSLVDKGGGEIDRNECFLFLFFLYDRERTIDFGLMKQEWDHMERKVFSHFGTMLAKFELVKLDFGFPLKQLQNKLALNLIFKIEFLYELFFLNFS